MVLLLFKNFYCLFSRFSNVYWKYYGLVFFFADLIVAKRNIWIFTGIFPIQHFERKKCRCLYVAHKLPNRQNGSVSNSFKCKLHQVVQNVSWSLVFSFSHRYRLIDVTSSLPFLQAEFLPQSLLLWICCLFTRSSHKGNLANRGMTVSHWNYSPTKLVWGRECGRHGEDYLQVVDW